MPSVVLPDSQNFAVAADNFFAHIFQGPYLLAHCPQRAFGERDQSAGSQKQFAYGKNTEHGVKRAHPPHFTPDIFGRLFDRLMNSLQKIAHQHAAGC